MLSGNRLKLLWCLQDHSGSLCPAPKSVTPPKQQRVWALSLLSASSLSTLPISLADFSWKLSEGGVAHFNYTVQTTSSIASTIKHFFSLLFLEQTLLQG